LGFKTSEAFSVLREGLVELNELVSSAPEGECPLISVPCMPFMFEDDDAHLFFWEDKFMPVFSPILENDFNAMVLYKCPNPPTMIFSTEPLNNADAVIGKKVRTWGGINDEALAAMGMIPFVVKLGELYTAVQRGMIDTAITSYVSATETKFWEVLEYVNYIPLGYNMGPICVNLDAFNALPEDLQEIVLMAGQDANNYGWYNLIFEKRRLLQMLLDGGMEFILPEPGTMDELRAKVEPVYQTWLDKVNYPEAEQLMREYGAIS
jgi:TRAP-type C4-dicarboxylate transport system substrate-binding protein